MINIPKLHPDTVEEVKQRVDIVDIISEKVVLKKQGKDLSGLCPFHEEKTPSFTVSPSKQMYYCFGCGAGGNAITFLKELEKRSFSEVVLDLAKRYQINIKTLAPQERQELQRQITLKEQLLEILAIAASFYQHALQQPEGKLALEYLKLERQLSDSTIEAFKLGYAPAGWTTLYTYLVEHKRYPVQLVEQAGLITPRKQGNGYYDKFRDRLMIPISDAQGKIIAFGGRTLTDEEPKYLNSPETEVFDKGKTLFALDQAKTAIQKQDAAIVVEGYFDAIALHAAGVPNVVASLGTALSLDQIRQLLRYSESKQIILNFDADHAGVKATQRAIGELEKLAYSGQVQLRILNLPDGKDADEFLRQSQHPNAYQDLIQNAPLWLDWQIHQIVKHKDIKQPDQYLQVVGAIVKLLTQVENPASRGYYIRFSSEILAQSDARLSDSIAEDIRKQLKKPIPKAANLITSKANSKKAIPTTQETLLEKAELLLLRAYIHLPEYRETMIQAIQDKQLEFSLAPHRVLWVKLQRIDSIQSLSASDLITELQKIYLTSPDQFSHIQRLFYLNEKTKLDLKRTPLIIQSAIASLERVMCEKQYRYVWEQWQKTNPKLDPQGFQFYSQEIQTLKTKMMEIDQQRRVKFEDLVTFAWDSEI